MPTQSTVTAQEVLAACGASSIYLVGVGMIVGALFAILTLLLLDFARRHRDGTLEK